MHLLLHLLLQSKQHNEKQFGLMNPLCKSHFQPWQEFLMRPHAHWEQPNEVVFKAAYLKNEQKVLYLKTYRQVENFQFQLQHEVLFFSLSLKLWEQDHDFFSKIQSLLKDRLPWWAQTILRLLLKNLVLSSKLDQNYIIKVSQHISFMHLWTIFILF